MEKKLAVYQGKCRYSLYAYQMYGLVIISEERYIHFV